MKDGGSFLPCILIICVGINYQRWLGPWKNVNVCFCSCIRDGGEAIGTSYYMERVCVWAWKIAEFLKRYKCMSLYV